MMDDDKGWGGERRGYSYIYTALYSYTNCFYAKQKKRGKNIVYFRDMDIFYT